MPEFKVGDKVHHKSDANATRYVVHVRASGRVDVSLTQDGEAMWKDRPSWDYVLIERADPTEYAIKLLTEAGYTITPPKPKLTGEIYVYHYPKEGEGAPIYAYSKEHWDKHLGTGAPGKVLLAILPWTEGDGLDKEVVPLVGDPDSMV